MEKLKATLFLFLALGAGVFGLLWLKNFSLKKRYHYGVVFKSAGFLGNGDPVSLQGVNVGKIKRIEIYTDSVIIRFYTERVRLRKGAYARIENEGVVGNRRLAVYQGNGDFLPQGSVIRGEETPTFTDFIFVVDRILKNIENVSAKTDATLHNLNDLLLNTNSQLLILSRKLKDLIASSKDLADNTNSKVDAMSYRLLQVANKLDETADKIDSLISSEGTLQKLMKNDSLYTEMDSTLKELRDLIKDVRKNPQKYINIEVKLF